MLREVRELLSPSRALPRRVRLERMERAARPAAQVWINGRALGPKPRPSHIYETYD
jgi:hypothetical protein